MSEHEYTLNKRREIGRWQWGEAGAWAYDEFERHNARYFGGTLPPLPIVLGLSAYGRCLGITRSSGEWGEAPRITLATQYLRDCEDSPSDTLLHEMVHAALVLAGECSKHNAKPWCREIMRITPLLDLPAIRAAPVLPSRGKRLAKPDHLSRVQIARWPHSLRTSKPSGALLHVSTY